MTELENNVRVALTLFIGYVLWMALLVVLGHF